MLKVSNFQVSTVEVMERDWPFSMLLSKTFEGLPGCTEWPTKRAITWAKYDYYNLSSVLRLLRFLLQEAACVFQKQPPSPFTILQAYQHGRTCGPRGHGPHCTSIRATEKIRSWQGRVHAHSCICGCISAYGYTRMQLDCQNAVTYIPSLGSQTMKRMNLRKLKFPRNLMLV